MQRYSDWASRLEVFLHEQRERKFKYGEFDCCLFVCDAIRVMTGQDPGGRFRGRYGSRRQAELLVRELGGWGGLAGDAAHRFEMYEVPPPQALRGDVALLGDYLVRRRRWNYSLGLVSLDGRHLLAASAYGIAAAPRDLAVRCWRV